MFNWKTIAAVVVAVLLLVWLAKREAGQVSAAVNPTSDQNIFYRGVNAVVDVFDDGMNNGSNTLGTKIYDWVHE